MRGWWECEELTTLVRLLVDNLAGIGRVVDRIGAAARPLFDPPARLRRPDKRADRRNIRAHYDIGNDFYSLMLDETMTYSCALFERPGMSLHDAQLSKLDRICRLLGLSPSDHVVEIGTGWGSFAVHAASQYGCRVTTTTISDAQYRYATKRVADAGLSDRVVVRDLDYRDLRGRYDKLVSIEMVEAVDWREHDTFFSACAELLRDDGLAALQAIVIADESFERAKRHNDFIRRFIFPGGCLPSITSLTASASRAGSACWSSTTSAAIIPKRCGPGGRTCAGTRQRLRRSRSASTFAGCGISTSPTAKRPSSNVTSATCRCCWRGPDGGRRSRRAAAGGVVALQHRWWCIRRRPQRHGYRHQTSRTAPSCGGWSLLTAAPPTRTGSTGRATAPLRARRCSTSSSSRGAPRVRQR